MTGADRAYRTEELLAQMDWVRSLARSLVADPHAADDLAQDAWLITARQPAGRIASGASLRAWLRSVVRRLARDRMRSERTRQEHSRSAPVREAPRATYEIVERMGVQRRVAEAVMALEEPYRSTVLYRYFDQLPGPRIAERMDTTPAAVRKRLERGLAILREQLDRELGTEDRGGMLVLLGFLEAGEHAGRPFLPTSAAPRGEEIPMAVKLIAAAGTVILAGLGAAYLLEPGDEDGRSTLAAASEPGPSGDAMPATSAGAERLADPRHLGQAGVQGAPNIGADRAPLEELEGELEEVWEEWIAGETNMTEDVTERVPGVREFSLGLSGDIELIDGPGPPGSWERVAPTFRNAIVRDAEAIVENYLRDLALSDDQLGERYAGDASLAENAVSEMRVVAASFEPDLRDALAPLAAEEALARERLWTEEAYEVTCFTGSDSPSPTGWSVAYILDAREEPYWTAAWRRRLQAVVEERDRALAAVR